jgi:uncharacterized coiled-coil DUF342 family protein
MSSPKRPLLAGGSPAQEALSKKLSALQNDLKRKQEQIASLTDGKVDSMRAQYDRMVADLIKQQEVLKSKHVELHKKLEDANVRHRKTATELYHLQQCSSAVNLFM